MAKRQINDEPEERSFADILAKPNGANFHLADLHIHTPVDKQFRCPKGVDPFTSKGQDEVAKGYIQAARNKNVTILAITEHNDVRWIDPTRKAAQDTEITVFPGVELSADSGAGGIHIIAIFEPSTETTLLDDLITQLGLPRGQRLHSDGSPKLCNKALSDLVDFITTSGGLCIAAHVLRDRGILKAESMTGEPRVKAWQNSKLFAAEIPQPRQQLSGFAKRVFENAHALYRRPRPIAAIYSSDARSFEEIGSHATWIKLSSKSLEGLKQAFLDWESRIRHPAELPPERYSKIIAIGWDEGFLGGTSVRLNDNLNCFVGGKGTGKSTAIETLRHAFDLKPRTPEVNRQYEGLLKETFKAGSKVSILIECHDPQPTRYIIERISPYPPMVKGENGEGIQGVSPCDLLCPEFYGQKEIYEIAQKKEFHLTLLDRFVGDRAESAVRQERELLRQLADNQKDLLRLSKRVAETADQVGRLPKLLDYQSRFKAAGVQVKLQEQQAFVKEEKVLQEAERRVVKFEEILKSTAAEINLDSAFLTGERVKGFPNPDLVNKSKSILETLKRKWEETYRSILDACLEARKGLGHHEGILGEWEKRFRGRKEDFDKVFQELQKEYPELDTKNYLEIEREIAVLQPMKEEIERYQKQVEDLKKQRTALLQRLIESRRQQFSIRDQVASDISMRLNGIMRISVIFEGERETLVDKLLGYRTGARREALKTMVSANDFTVLKFCQALRTGQDTLQRDLGITGGTAESLYKGIPYEDVYELETFRIPDSTMIQLNIGTVEREDYRPIERLSVGQKSTAILLLILLESKAPLIIDQPEDDLDNKFIYEDIVTKLRQEKERRQFVVATHNANIPVLGDAELILVMKAETQNGGLRGRVERSGSIDDPDLREAVELVLEGGKQAFELRRLKYGI
jgi:hypothetical protein